MPRRLALCLLLIAGLLTGCGMFDGVLDLEAPSGAPEATSTPTDPEAPEADEPQEPDSDETPVGPPPPAPGLPASYEPSASETHPNAKTLGAEVAQQLTTYDAGQPFEDVTGALASGETRDRIAEQAGALYHEGAWSRGEIVYPQFGGLTADSASIMVVVAQTIGEAGAEAPRTEVRTIDVRLGLEDGAWVLDSIASVGGEPVERPDDLSPEATAVLEHDHIELPDSARWDIYRGVIHPDALALLARLADTTGDVGVVVFETGHPYHVFGTDRMSDHLRGRAVDIYRVGGELVVEGRDSKESTTYATVQTLYEDPLKPIIGSPWALDEYGGRSFTDPVHRDHLHVAVRPTAEEGEEAAEEDAPADDAASDAPTADVPADE